MKRTITQGLLLASLCTGCLETKEEITIRPDGSATVQVAIKGGTADVEDGYPIPFGGSWRPTSPTTTRWAAGERPPSGTNKEVRLQVQGTFASVEAIPEVYATDDEPYASAYLRRQSTLQIERRGDRTVYVFERRFFGRTYRAWDAMRRIDESLDSKLKERIDDLQDLDPLQWSGLTHVVRDAYQAWAEALTRESTLAETAAEDGLRPAEQERLVAAARDALAAKLTQPRLMATYDALRQIQAEEKRRRDRGEPEPAEPQPRNPLAELEMEIEQTLRETLARALAETGMEAEARHRIRTRLEWCITAMNHTADLRDESFSFALNLPGTIVGGNWDARPDAGHATWSFRGEDLLDRDVILRAVSIVE